MTPFDFINAINFTKEDLFTGNELSQKDYNSFIVNRGLSYFPDTVLYANEMNRNNSIAKDWQFSFLLNSISKKKRFSKWTKKESELESISLLKEYFGYSSERAEEALRILTEEQLLVIKEKLYKGGK